MQIDRSKAVIYFDLQKLDIYRKRTVQPNQRLLKKCTLLDFRKTIPKKVIKYSCKNGKPVK